MSLPAGQNAAQVAGTGTVVSIGGLVSAGSTTFTTIGSVTKLDFASHKRDVVDTTTFDSLGIKQKVGTLLDLGSATLTCMRIGNDAGQLAAYAACLAGGAYQFKAVLPLNAELGQTTTGDTVNFSGIVTEAGQFSVDLTTPSSITITVELNSYAVVVGS